MPLDCIMIIFNIYDYIHLKCFLPNFKLNMSIFPLLVIFYIIKKLIINLLPQRNSEENPKGTKENRLETEKKNWAFKKQ